LSPQPSQPPAQAASFLHPIWPSPLASRNLAREPRARQSKHEAATDSKSVAAQLIPSPASSPSANRLELASEAPLIFRRKQGPSRALPPILFRLIPLSSPPFVSSRERKEGREKKSGEKKKKTKPQANPRFLRSNCSPPCDPPPARPLPTTSPLLPSAPAPDDLGLSPARADFSPNRAPLPARGHAEHLRYGQRAVSLRESPRVPTETARGLQRSVGRGLVRSDWWLRLGFGFLLLLL